MHFLYAISMNIPIAFQMAVRRTAPKSTMHVSRAVMTTKCLLWTKTTLLHCKIHRNVSMTKTTLENLLMRWRNQFVPQIVHKLFGISLRKFTLPHIKCRINCFEHFQPFLIRLVDTFGLKDSCLKAPSQCILTLGYFDMFLW